GGVGDVRHVHPAAGQLPDQPRVDGAEGQLAALRPLTSTLDVVEDPSHSGGGEVGVDDQARPLADQRLVALGAQPFAVALSTAILPYDGVVDRLAVDPVPDYRGLPLVGDADGGHVLGAHAGAGDDLCGDPRPRGPDLVRVVLDPARARVDLSELPL